MLDSVDVFIPYHPKDRHALPHVVKSLYQHLRPRPKRVVCVGSGLSGGAAQAVVAAGGEFLDERAVSEVPHRSAMPEILVRRRIRTGWYYQQLLKWAFRRLSTTAAYVVIDADSVLVNDLSLQQADGTYLLDRTTQWHEPYFDHFARILGWRPARQDSFIINYQIIDVALLDELLAEIETRGGGKPWHTCIMDAVDRTQNAGFSEFETYGYWLATTHPERFASRMGANHETSIKRLWLRWWINPKAQRAGFTSVSYHQFNAEKKPRRLLGR